MATCLAHSGYAEHVSDESGGTQNALAGTSDVSAG